MKKCILAITLMAAAFIMSACNENKSDDRSDIEALINGTYAAYFDSDGTTGDTEPGNSIQNMPNAAATQPAAWWRTGSLASRIITIDFPSEDYATAEVDDTIEGILYVDRTFDGQLNPNMRDIACKRTKYASFSKTGNTWVLTGLSLGRWYMENETDQKVKVTSMRVVGPGYDKTFYGTTSIIDLDEWPRFNAGDTVTVTMVTTNTSGSGYSPVTFGYLHHPVYNRDVMTESPTNTFQGSCSVVGYWWGWGFLGADAVDSQMLQTETGPDYNWDVWTIPYKIE